MALTLRPMTPTEFDEWQIELAEVFVAEARAAGRHMPDDAVERELADNVKRLPQGAATPRMLVVIAERDGEPVGRAWAGLDHPRGTPDTAFLYDIEVLEDLRGQGLGADLLEAVEAAVRAEGVPSLELNVFGNNPAAIKLYTSAGYAVTSMVMRKDAL